MIWFTLIIPTIAAIILCWNIPNTYRTKNIKLFAGLGIPAISLFIFGIMYSSMIYSNVHDTEYLSYYYTKIRHTDSWNEQVTRTKTRTVYINGKPHTQTYTVKETVEHPEEWHAYLNNNKSISISKKEFNKIKSLWNTPEIFIDMHRFYYTKDGDAQEYNWNNKKSDIQIYTKSHSYINPIINSESQFKFNNISKKEAKELRLYDYSDINKHKQNPIIGYNKFVTQQNIKNIQYLNAYYGYNKQICFYVLIYPNTTVSIVEDQKSYWQGGNKNEFIICVGIDSISNSVQWAECFSWQDDITYDVKCKNYIYSQNKFDINKLSVWLEHNIHNWKRKEFKDFNYITVHLYPTQELIILVVMIIITIIMGVSCFIYYDKNC